MEIDSDVDAGENVIDCEYAGQILCKIFGNDNVRDVTLVAGDDNTK